MTLSLERRAALWGTRTAVVDVNADRRVSYDDLESEADAIARRLAALGVEPGDPVAVVSRNRVETLALFFAVRRLGAILAPVSHRLTPATVEGPLETVDPEVVVHEAAQRDLVREVPDDRTHTFEDLGRHEGEAYERVDRDPEDSLLYLHATGETDRPPVGASSADTTGEAGDESERSGASLAEDPRTASRVVDVPERTVEWNCITAVAAWGLGKDDCAPALLPLSDADGLHRLVLPLLYVGGRVVLLRAFDPEDALAAVAGESATAFEEGATALFAGATEYRELVECEGFETTDFGSVELIASRSPLPADVREALARQAPLVRTYGRVETGPNDLYRPPESTIDDPPDRDCVGRSVTDCVGRPFPDCEARIVSEDGESLPEGEVGDLEFRGPVTARGYLDGDGGTHAFPEWVPTGDLAYRESGDYYVLGSGDEAVDSGVVRVHPREIERALETREDVTAAGVVPDPDGASVAFVGEASPGELRGFLDDELPDEVTVGRIDRVASLPRRPTGEPDRAKLRRELGGEE